MGQGQRSRIRHFRLGCRHEGCHWSKHLSPPPEVCDLGISAEGGISDYCLVVLRAHADVALHGRRIVGVVIDLDEPGHVWVIRHPKD